MYRLLARYWWPGLRADVDCLVRACVHCRMANNATHERAGLMEGWDTKAPLEVAFLDKWTPGESVTDRMGDAKVQIYLCCMSSFAAVAFVKGHPEAEAVTMTAMEAFFTPYGLPKLVVVDTGSDFAGMFKALFGPLGVSVLAVDKENHKVVRNERFHKYLNKVQRIGAADRASMHQWRLATKFAAYAWNSALVDMTDIERAVVAIGRSFPFPIELAQEQQEPLGDPTHHVVDHHNVWFPLLDRQHSIFDLLVWERRERHRAMKNQLQTEKTFKTGDLVIVHKQMQSRVAEGFSAKMAIRGRGPYRIVRQAGSNLYWVQCLPFTEGLGNGRAGREIKENVSCLERIPNTLIIHRRTDGLDTRLRSMSGQYVANPLEQRLRVREPGTYRRANQREDFVYKKVRDMWELKIEPTDTDRESEEDEGEEEPPQPEEEANSQAQGSGNG
eukprot:15355524-Ditylum_brightwellii.AAC.1